MCDHYDSCKEAYEEGRYKERAKMKEDHDDLRRDLSFYEDPMYTPEYLNDRPRVLLDGTPEVPQKGFKLDQGKVRMDLVPPEVPVSMAEILTFGLSKGYPERNWEEGMRWGKVYAALQRHLLAWWSGQSNDPESGKSHLWHSLCCLGFLICYELRGIGQDDRPRTPL